MPQSLSKIIVHLIFSTKDRRPFLDEAIRQELFPYLATILRAYDCEAYRVGGASDHIHLAIRLGRTVSVSKVIEELKTSSSKWIKAHFGGMADFAWQRGYGAFSVETPHLDGLIAYIDGQEDHHRRVSFMDEYRRLLAECGIEFDERYVFD